VAHPAALPSTRACRTRRCPIALRCTTTTRLQLQLEIRPKSRAAVNKVLLVGGATRMPAVKRFLANMTGLAPEGHEAVDPDEAVALGAAVQVRASAQSVAAAHAMHTGHTGAGSQPRKSATLRG
jgi:molecular chaperone DnaK (HSP70)